MSSISAGAWLKDTSSFFDASGVPTARLDALVLLEDATDKERGWLLAHPEFELSAKQVATLEKQVERRCKHEPLAYIRGKSEFYGRDFIVNAATLQPRSETETMIDLLKQLGLPSGAVLADIGTGSGAIAITAQLELPKTEVYATEINRDALDVALQNVQKHHLTTPIHLGNLLEPLLERGVAPDVLLCNLPYVPDSHTINKAAMQEPKLAIFGGSDGLDLYRSLLGQVESMSTKPRYILTEALPGQHEGLQALLNASGYAQTAEADFIQIFATYK